MKSGNGSDAESLPENGPARVCMNKNIKHLPKRIDESTERFHYFETLWKKTGLDLLERHAGRLEGLSLLDYGCGRGETLRMAAERGMMPLGTDVDEECVALSMAHGPAARLEHPGDPRRQFGENSFDAVTCFHVLEHVDRPREVLASLGAIARSHVVVAVPNLRSIPRPRYITREPPSVNEGHLQGWDHAHFRNLAERHCGMRLVAWGHDHVRVPVLSGLVAGMLGEKAAIRLETGLLLRCFKFHSASIIALLEKVG